MKKKLFVVIALFLMSQQTFSQQCNTDVNWKITDDIERTYFDNFFVPFTNHDPSGGILKLKVQSSEKILIADFTTFLEYYKIKNNLPPNLVRSECKKALLRKISIPLEDTLFFKERSANDFNHVFVEDSMLNKYRKYGVRDFVLQNCEGGLIKSKGVSVYLIAYLYENRVFWDNLSFRISNLALGQIEKQCKIRWDTANKVWFDLCHCRPYEKGSIVLATQKPVEYQANSYVFQALSEIDGFIASAAVADAAEIKEWYNSYSYNHSVYGNEKKLTVSSILLSTAKLLFFQEHIAKTSD